MEILGKTVISDEVFNELARTALTKVNNVLVQEKKGGTFSGLTQVLTERLAPQISVKKVENTEDAGGYGSVAFDLRLTVLYGVKIPEAVNKVRLTIKDEVESITGYSVEKVDIIIDKIVKVEAPFQEEKQKEEIEES